MGNNPLNFLSFVIALKPPWYKNPKSRLKTTPKGWFLPIKATAIPTNP